jgi:ectoine hydroxylase-related dioxygenase (phytanoyl-CoA dioxygenase family)
MTPASSPPSRRAAQLQIAALRTAWTRDGVVFLRGALDARAMRLAEQAFAWSLGHPGPGAHDVLPGSTGAFYQDHANPAAYSAYHALLSESGLADLTADLMGSASLWLLYEQIWLKQGGARLATPWHQDLPYVPMAGAHLATCWISLDPVARQRSLEFIPGSHRGPLYNPTAFDPGDPTAAMFSEGAWPSLPDIDAQREAWPIASWATEPGDLIVFHPAILHGGAPTRRGERRRTISLRFFGDDAFCAGRPDAGLHDIDKLTTDDGQCEPMVAMARQPDGAVFRHPGFPRLR